MTYSYRGDFFWRYIANDNISTIPSQEATEFTTGSDVTAEQKTAADIQKETLVISGAHYYLNLMSSLKCNM